MRNLLNKKYNLKQFKIVMANTTGKKFGGRKKGTPNKTTADIKEA